METLLPPCWEGVNASEIRKQRYFCFDSDFIDEDRQVFFLFSHYHLKTGISKTNFDARVIMSKRFQIVLVYLITYLKRYILRYILDEFCKTYNLRRKHNETRTC